jgi:uncharacterized phage-associated protein
MSIPVQTIAKFILQSSDRISNLKLQKLLYYAQGWHLGIKGVPLFPERLEAWVHGPVQPSMFQEYKTFGWMTIEKPTDHISLIPAAEKHIRDVLKVYGKYSGDQLERLSHSEKPWLDARAGLSPDTPSKNVITPESMRDFFAAKART